MVVNLLYRALTATEYKALNHGLQFGILPLKFNFIDMQIEFENLYKQVRPHLQNTKRILFKTKLINLHNKYKFTYFYDKLCEKNRTITLRNISITIDTRGQIADNF